MYRVFGPDDWITAAWTTMLITQGIVPEKDASKVARVILEIQKIPATQASADLLNDAAEEVLGKKLGMTDTRLRELLDSAYFIKVTNSKGGVVPEETARMIADRREKLAEARARHLRRIETLEMAQQWMLSDLRKLCANPE